MKHRTSSTNMERAGGTENLNNMDSIDDYVKRSQRLWVFGYGSLVWKTGFKYTNKKIGHIDDYVRRFWQGCASHRGTPDSPGRVATLIKKENGRVWGVAFELVGKEQIQEAMHHLGMRECKMGGYVTELVPFYCRDTKQHLQCIVFNALPSNANFLGSAPTEALAKQIVSSSGPSGHNVEYVTRLAEYIRTHIPEESDDHLFTIESNVRLLLEQDNICISTLLLSSSITTRNCPLYQSLWKTWNSEQNHSFSKRLSAGSALHS